MRNFLTFQLDVKATLARGVDDMISVFNHLDERKLLNKLPKY